MVLSTVAVGVAAHNADRISHGSLERALIVNGANLFTYAVLWTARYFVLNRFLFGTRAGGVPISSPQGDDPGELVQPGFATAGDVTAGPAVGDETGVEVALSQIAELAVTDTADPAI
jgi:hypothetical protein